MSMRTNPNALSSKNALRVTHSDTEAVYIDRDGSPVLDAPTIETIRVGKVNKVTRNPSLSAVYPASAKGGRQIVAKREILIRHKIDDANYEEPIKVTLSIEAGNGAINYLNTLDGSSAAKFIADMCVQAPSALVQFETHQDYASQSDTQPVIDGLLFGACEWNNIPTTT